MHITNRRSILTRVLEVSSSLAVIVLACALATHHVDGLLKSYEQSCVGYDPSAVPFVIQNVYFLGAVNGLGLSVPFLLIVHGIFSGLKRKYFAGEILGCISAALEISLIILGAVSPGPPPWIVGGIILFYMLGLTVCCFWAAGYFIYGIDRWLKKRDDFLLQWPNNFATLACILWFFWLMRGVFEITNFP